MSMPRAPHQLTSNVKLLQKIVLVHRGRFLLLQRDPQSFSRPNCWDLPGGNSEWPTHITHPTSNLHQIDAAREVAEETGIELSPSAFTHNALVYFETFFDPGREIFTVLCGWRIELPDEEELSQVQLSEEHTDFVWETPGEALTLDFGGQKGAFLPRILQAAARQK